jgi:hypothetical protein
MRLFLVVSAVLSVCGCANEVVPSSGASSSASTGSPSTLVREAAGLEQAGVCSASTWAGTVPHVDTTIAFLDCTSRTLVVDVDASGAAVTAAPASLFTLNVYSVWPDHETLESSSPTLSTPEPYPGAMPLARLVVTAAGGGAPVGWRVSLETTDWQGQTLGPVALVMGGL